MCNSVGANLRLVGSTLGRWCLFRLVPGRLQNLAVDSRASCPRPTLLSAAERGARDAVRHSAPPLPDRRPRALGTGKCLDRAGHAATYEEEQVALGLRNQTLFTTVSRLPAAHDDRPRVALTWTPA